MQLWRTNVTAVSLPSLQSTLGFMGEDMISLLLNLPSREGSPPGTVKETSLLSSRLLSETYLTS